MANKVQQNFSRELLQSEFSDKKLKSVGHPLLKQVITEILTTGQKDNAFGSSFGEAIPPAPNR